MCFPITKNVTDIEYSIQALANLPGVSFASYNIRSVYKNVDELKVLLNGSNIDCLCLQETFLGSVISDPEISVPGYNIIRCDRHEGSGKSSGGGLMFYTKSKRDFREIEHSHVCTPNIETS